jgi:magnesium-transporting ATPase (P-type)
MKRERLALSRDGAGKANLASLGDVFRLAGTMKATSREETLSWFAVPTAQVVKQLRTDLQAGLGPGEVSERFKKFGPNRLPTAGKRSPLMRFFMQINNVLIYVLLGAAVGKLLLGEWLDASVILGVVIVNALLGFIQEGKAEKALDSIRNMLSAEAMAVREGNTRMIPAEELVPGDVVLLQSGDKVPADIRLCEVIAHLSELLREARSPLP